MNSFARALAPLLLVGLGSQTAMAQSMVRVQAVKRQDIQQHERVTGAIRATHKSVLSALEDGRVKDILVRAGHSVKKDQVLLRLDDRRLKAQILELTAQIGVAKAELEVRRAEHKDANDEALSLRSVAKSRAITRRRHQRAEAELSMASARVKAAEQTILSHQGRLAGLNIRLEDMTIRAPFAGQITARHTETGQWLRAGDAVVTLVSSHSVEAWLNVPERFAGRLTKDSPVHIQIGALDHSQKAKALRVVPQVDKTSRSFAIVAELDNPSKLLADGMSAEAWLPIGAKKSRLVVPKNALIRRVGAIFVYRIAQKDGQTIVQSVPVTPLFELGLEVVIDDNNRLKDTHSVVVEGNERLRPGQNVTVIQKPAQSSNTKSPKSN